MNEAVMTVPLLRLTANELPETATDLVAVEEPLEIRIQNEPFVTLMRTPGHDRELVTGFLFTEGLIKSASDIRELAPSPNSPGSLRGTILNVILASPLKHDLAALRRHVVASSSCGICSKTSLSDQVASVPVSSRLQVDSAILHTLPDRLRAAQKTFAQTGGLHASAWFNPEGKLLLLREDVGRHNALDKLIGHRLLHGLTNTDGILQVSGRVALEIVQKALAARFPIIAAISAPTSLAVEFAEKHQQTLIGFLREGRMNIYTHPQRVRTGKCPH